jgi:hypothetical protein
MAYKRTIRQTRSLATVDPRPSVTAGIEALRRCASVWKGFVVYAGHDRLPLGGGVEAVPFGSL